LAHYILIVLAFKSMHHFPPHLIVIYRTLQFICIVQNEAFLCHCHDNKPDIQYGPYFNLKFVSTTVNKSCQKNFQLRILINEVFRDC